MNYEIIVKEMELKRDIYYKGSLLLTYSIKYPQFFSPRFQAQLGRINLYYKTKALQFQNYCEQKLYKMAITQYKYSIENGFPIQTYEAMVVFDVTYNQSCALSIYFDQYEYTGGAHGITWRYSDTWLVKSAKRISLSKMFPAGFNYKAYIIELIYKQIEQQIKEGTNQYFDDYRKLVPENFNEDSFYLKPGGIVVYYQQYDIAPHSSGIPEFFVPYSKGGAMPPTCRW